MINKLIVATRVRLAWLPKWGKKRKPEKKLSKISQDILKSVENYPNTDLDIEVIGNKAIINGEIYNEMDEFFIIKSIKSFPEIDYVVSEIKYIE